MATAVSSPQELLCPWHSAAPQEELREGCGNHPDVAGAQLAAAELCPTMAVAQVLPGPDQLSAQLKWSCPGAEQEDPRTE